MGVTDRIGCATDVGWLAIPYSVFPSVSPCARLSAQTAAGDPKLDCGPIRVGLDGSDPRAAHGLIACARYNSSFCPSLFSIRMP